MHLFLIQLEIESTLGQEVICTAMCELKSLVLILRTRMLHYKIIYWHEIE